MYKKEDFPNKPILTSQIRFDTKVDFLKSYGEHALIQRLTEPAIYVNYFQLGPSAEFHSISVKKKIFT